MELVKVVWFDAQDHPETWVKQDDAEKFGEALCAIESIGFLVRKTSKYVTLAGDWDTEDKNYGRVSKIPTAWIDKIIHLTDVEPPTEAMG